MSITILKPGMMSSLQDLGRWGFQQFGVPIGGAMDKVSASLANIICGNDENEVVIEMTLHGTSIMFNTQTYCALSGGGCKAYIDDVELPFNRLLWIPAFSIIKTTANLHGCRSYLAVSGGFSVKKVLGSASTYTPSGIGGTNGRNLVTGDMVALKREQDRQAASGLNMLANGVGISHWHAADLITPTPEIATVHAIKGPEFDCFNIASQENIFNSVFTISSQSNRMGYRLEGKKFTLEHKTEMVSTAVTAGIVQITHEGDPIILMADAQTTGGYPRIVRVCSADLPVLAQCKPGTKIQFREIGEEESLKRYNKIVEGMKRVKLGLNQL
ncbi:MAG: putative hydrolase subunit antagonist of KipI [Bacteroidota bacterium]|jgi:antagonist of KipI